jgi:hypothetical protein
MSTCIWCVTGSKSTLTLPVPGDAFGGTSIAPLRVVDKTVASTLGAHPRTNASDNEAMVERTMDVSHGPSLRTGNARSVQLWLMQENQRFLS